MKMIENDDVTMKYSYGNQDEEFVLCYRSRPFSVLSSSSLPTPSGSYIDHLLVRELGIKMTDLQCKKFSFGGVKLRLLGRISVTVQCVKDGRPSGNIHLTASVVENLYQHFDTHCVAGKKTHNILMGSNCTSSGAPSEANTPSRSSRAESVASSPSRAESPASTTSRASSPYSPITPAGIISSTNTLLTALAKYPGSPTRSPPGFHPVPKYPRPSQIPDTTPNHGPGRCTWDQCIVANGGSIRPGCPPDCGYHPRWRLPADYQACGPGCAGAHCQCLARERPKISSGWINYMQDNYL